MESFREKRKRLQGKDRWLDLHMRLYTFERSPKSNKQYHKKLKIDREAFLKGVQ
jgi:hypothetical protein